MRRRDARVYVFGRSVDGMRFEVVRVSLLSHFFNGTLWRCLSGCAPSCTRTTGGLDHPLPHSLTSRHAARQHPLVAHAPASVRRTSTSRLMVHDTMERAMWAPKPAYRLAMDQASPACARVRTVWRLYVSVVATALAIAVEARGPTTANHCSNSNIVHVCTTPSTTDQPAPAKKARPAMVSFAARSSPAPACVRVFATQHGFDAIAPAAPASAADHGVCCSHSHVVR